MAVTAERQAMVALDDLAANAARTRARLGMSYRQAGADAGVVYSTFQRLDAGDDVSMRNARKVLAWVHRHSATEDELKAELRARLGSVSTRVLVWVVDEAQRMVDERAADGVFE